MRSLANCFTGVAGSDGIGRSWLGHGQGARGAEEETVNHAKRQGRDHHEQETQPEVSNSCRSLGYTAVTWVNEK